MAGVLKSVSAYIKKQPSSDTLVDKIDTLSTIESLTDTFQSLKVLLDTPEVRTTLSKQIANPSRNEGPAKTFTTAYRELTAHLPSRVQISERKTPLGLMSLITDRVINDLSALRSEYPHFFNGTEQSGMSADELKLSVVIILGYLEGLTELATWLTYWINLGLSDDKQVIPPYQSEHVKTDTNKIAKTLDEIAGRNPPLFTNQLRNFMQTGHDLLIQSDGHTIDQYASDSDYTTDELAHVNGFVRKTSLVVGHHLIEWRRERNEKLKYLRGWMDSRKSLLQLEMSGKDPNSPEYKRLEKITQNYMNEISKTDKKIYHYEHG